MTVQYNYFLLSFYIKVIFWPCRFLSIHSILTSALCILIQIDTNTMKVKFEYEMNQFNCLKLAAFLNNSLPELAYIVLLNQADYWYSC